MSYPCPIVKKPTWVLEVKQWQYWVVSWWRPRGVQWEKCCIIYVLLCIKQTKFLKYFPMPLWIGKVWRLDLWAKPFIVALSFYIYALHILYSMCTKYVTVFFTCLSFACLLVQKNIIISVFCVVELITGSANMSCSFYAESSNLLLANLGVSGYRFGMAFLYSPNDRYSFTLVTNWIFC